MNKTLRTGLAGCLLFGAQACSADAGIGKPVQLDAKQLKTASLGFDGKLVAAYRIGDREGDHILVLSRKEGQSPAQPRAKRVERIDLMAAYYGRGASGQWKQEWTIRDFSDCPGLDVSADFATEGVAFTDLNKDGKAEVTVPYRLFCGGAIEPSTVKVILREGATKLAIRGEALVKISQPGIEPFGGEHKHDAALLAPERAAYKRHLDAVWAKVAVERR